MFDVYRNRRHRVISERDEGAWITAAFRCPPAVAAQVGTQAASFYNDAERKAGRARGLSSERENRGCSSLG